MKKHLSICIVCILLSIFLVCLGGCANSLPPSNNIPDDVLNNSTNNGENDMHAKINSIFIYINNNRLEIKLEQNSSVNALLDILQNSDIVYTANDYGGFEKVGNIGHTLPTNNTQITATTGDVVLYQGNQICILVGSNTWSYTKLGKINNYSVDELRLLLSINQGSVEVTLSLT